MKTLPIAILIGLALPVTASAAPVPPAIGAAPVQTLAPMALNSFSNPPTQIATARVVDNTGATVGAVQKVELDSAGKPSAVDIALLGGDRMVRLGAAQLSYDEPNNVVTADMDKSQLAALPSVPNG